MFGNVVTLGMFSANRLAIFCSSFGSGGASATGDAEV